MKRVSQSITSGAKNIIGKNVEQARLCCGYTQKQLSEKLEIYGLYICRDSVSRIESGMRQVTDFEALMIVHVLNIDMNQLFDGALRDCLKSSTDISSYL